MQNVLTHVSDRSSHLTGKRSKKQPKNFQRSVRGSYYTAISYDVIHDVFVFYICLSESRVWFCSILWSQSKLLASDYSLRLVSAKDKVTQWTFISELHSTKRCIWSVKRHNTKTPKQKFNVFKAVYNVLHIISQTVYCSFWAYPSFYFLVFFCFYTFLVVGSVR